TPLETVEASLTPLPSVDLDQSLAEAYEKRPEALQADAQIRAAQKGILLARRSSEPTLRLSWNFSYTPDAGGFAPKTTTWAAVATVRIPLFDQGLSRARNQQAQADLNIARLAKQQILDSIALEVRQAYLALVEAQERLHVTTAGLVQAEEQYRLAQVRYKAGVTLTPGASPLLEISDAQTALTQAQTNQVNAQYDVQNARARLERALGLYAYDNTAYPGLPAPKTGGKQ
ncbi:MAG TPA: TolC family protein, partial [Dehalococcoidia bacterium]|nr:TolC family protein [Dehalococcoidia bacterium]